MEIIYFKKKKMNSLTNEQQKSYENPKFVIFVKKNLKHAKDKTYQKVWDHSHDNRGSAHNM